MSRTIQELNSQELKKVFDANSMLQAEVIADYEEQERFYINDVLNHLKDSFSTYCVSFDDENYINVSDNELFLKGVIKAQADYCILSDDILINSITSLHYIAHTDSDYQKLNEMLEELRSMVLDFFDYLTSYTMMEIKNHFIDFHVQERMDESYYITNEDFTLYQAIIKSYK